MTEEVGDRQNSEQHQQANVVANWPSTTAVKAAPDAVASNAREAGSP